jgi:GNAT superfamily N-acetyltransferase
LTIEVRPAVAGDAQAAARLHVRSWQSAYRGLIAQQYLDSLDPNAWASRYNFGQEAGGVVPATVVAVDGSTIRGLAITRLCRDADLSDFGELSAIYVDPEYARTGIGRLLITAARARLRAVGATAAALWVLDGNVGARRFYERDGWAFDGTRRTHTWGGAPADEVRYRRAL